MSTAKSVVSLKDCVFSSRYSLFYLDVAVSLILSSSIYRNCSQ